MSGGQILALSDVPELEYLSILSLVPFTCGFQCFSVLEPYLIYSNGPFQMGVCQDGPFQTTAGQEKVEQMKRVMEGRGSCGKGTDSLPYTVLLATRVGEH